MNVNGNFHYLQNSGAVIEKSPEKAIWTALDATKQVRLKIALRLMFRNVPDVF